MLRVMLITIAVLFCALPENALAQSEQIRVADYCRVISARLKAQLADPLYKKALERKKNGTLLPMSRDRLAYVERLRVAMKFGKCK